MSDEAVKSSPVWYRSIVENRHVSLRVGAEHFEAHAQTLSPEEKARVWPHLVEVFAPYEGYQRKTPRDIPVIRLTRHGVEVAHEDSRSSG